MAMRTLARCLLLATVAACGSDDPAVPERPTQFGGDRPVELQLPLLTEGETYPLVLILHGYGVNGFFQQAYFGMRDLAVDKGMFVLAPDGLLDSSNRQYWNADDVCCDFDNTNPDDVAYLGGLIDDVLATWPVDPARVRVIGHSNGGFMSYRLACERADVVTSLVSLAGNAASVPCTPSDDVSVLHVHGTADESVPFAGAVPSVSEWAGHNGCGGTRTAAGTLDLDAAVGGAETQVGVTDGCPANGAVELWTMEGSLHAPNLKNTFAMAITDWWNAHTRR